MTDTTRMTIRQHAPKDMTFMPSSFQQTGTRIPFDLGYATVDATIVKAVVSEDGSYADVTLDVHVPGLFRHMQDELELIQPEDES